jgi:hypothetical protein
MSKFRGVRQFGKRFQARIAVNGKELHLGMFDTPEEAAAAYEKAVLDFYGPDVLTSFKLLVQRHHQNPKI